jgi:hypothetical protein
MDRDKGELLTYGEIINSITAVQTTDEASDYFAFLMGYYVSQFQMDGQEAAKLAAENIGYLAGYCDRETGQRIHKLFNEFGG